MHTHACTGIFFAEYWLSAHAGLWVDGGRAKQPGAIAAPQSVKNAVSALRVQFEKRGRVNAWSPSSPSGNPMLGSDWSSFLKAYERHAVDRGYKPASAIPAITGEYELAERHLTKIAFSSMHSGREKLMAAMHLVCLTIMWACGCRLDTIGQLQCNDFVFADGSPAFDHIWPQMRIAKGVDVYIHSQVQKGRVGYSYKRFLVTHHGEEFSGSPLWAVHKLVTLCYEIQQPISTYIMRALEPGKGVKFQQKGLNANVLSNRMGTVLKELGLKSNLSAYSFVKGGSQLEAANGKSSAEVTINRGRKSVACHEKHYLHRDRQPGSQRIVYRMFRVNLNNDDISRTIRI